GPRAREAELREPPLDRVELRVVATPRRPRSRGRRPRAAHAPARPQPPHEDAAQRDEQPAKAPGEPVLALARAPAREEERAPLPEICQRLPRRVRPGLLGDPH